MRYFIELFTDHFILILLVGTVFFLMGTVGSIRLRYVELSLDLFPRIVLTATGFSLLGLALLLLSPDQAVGNIRHHLLSNGGVYRFYSSDKNWVGELIFEEGSNDQVLVSMEVERQFAAKVAGRSSETSIRIPVIHTQNEGTVQLQEDGFRIDHISLSNHYFDTLRVNGLEIEGMRVLGAHQVGFSAGVLKPIVAYGGHVTYKNLDKNTLHRSFLVITKCESGCED